MGKIWLLSDFFGHYTHHAPYPSVKPNLTIHHFFYASLILYLIFTLPSELLFHSDVTASKNFPQILLPNSLDRGALDSEYLWIPQLQQLIKLYFKFWYAYLVPPEDRKFPEGRGPYIISILIQPVFRKELGKNRIQ